MLQTGCVTGHRRTAQSAMVSDDDSSMTACLGTWSPYIVWQASEAVACKRLEGSSMMQGSSCSAVHHPGTLNVQCCIERQQLDPTPYC